MQLVIPTAPIFTMGSDPSHSVLAGTSSGWQDGVFTAIMDAEPSRIWQALEASPEVALNGQLIQRHMGGHTFFIFLERLYTADPAGVREALGSSFCFEDEATRSRLAAWLEMIGAKAGDTLLHLVMRLNGVEDTVKARCAVEILGRGASFEIENCDGELCSMVDSAFKLAWLKELPAWRARREQQQHDQAAADALERRRAAERRSREQQRRELAAQRTQADDARKKQLAEIQESNERRTFHQALESMLIKLDRRDRRQEKQNPAFRELMTDLRAIPKQIEMWLARP